MKLIKEQDMPLLGRKRLTYLVEHKGQKTPARLTLRDQVAKAHKVEPDHVSIRHVYQKFGSGISKVIANIYSDTKIKDLVDITRKKDIERLKKQQEPQEAKN